MSHSSVDKALVRVLSGDIAEAGIETWLDEAELNPGDGLTTEILASIRGSNFVVLCISQNSCASRWVQLELDAARRAEISVLPVLIGAVSESDLSPAIRDRLYLDIRGAAYEVGVRRLVTHIRGAPPPDWLSLDSARKDYLVRLSEQPELFDNILDIIIAATTKPDPTERYWAYIALGEIGGERATATLRIGLDDKNSFARHGAEEAIFKD